MVKPRLCYVEIYYPYISHIPGMLFPYIQHMVVTKFLSTKSLSIRVEIGATRASIGLESVKYVRCPKTLAFFLRDLLVAGLLEVVLCYKRFQRKIGALLRLYFSRFG
ncbi:hypothetical protein LX64_00264 [Chitinophaga skermanii]|uniref:Uncharacterized protein n=1 Tax=Chitinophaga skermanii TaxID=331697 RepID=A0A327R1D2_9BACT|nr:hypothetical protein LX64_00264 [Chitinophaga skermanii]